VARGDPDPASSPDAHSRPVTGLVLTGGGARAAYQVGVLRAVARIRRDCLGRHGAERSNPFQVIAGTSAGAINATALACHADHFDVALSGLVEVWRNFHAEQVYRSDSIGVIRTGARWLSMLTLGWAIARWRRLKPRSLLDNAPLGELLARVLQTERLPDVMRDGHLQALAVTASSYSSGHHVTFYDSAREIPPWARSQRLAVPSRIETAHLLASSAIPFVFPAAPLRIDGRTEWFGDGSMRQAAPISPAVHLGAERILVVGAGRMHEPPGRRVASEDYPNIAQIAGHALSNIFLDALSVDIERLQRINRTLALMPPAARSQCALRPIDVLVIAPSQRLDDIAARHVHNLPGPVRALLRAVGVRDERDDASGAALASYLLFEAPYTRELMALGASDTHARHDEVARFFGWDRRHEPRPPASTLRNLSTAN
jgi:NTE family protein